MGRLAFATGVAALALGLAGCAAQLAPLYDQAISGQLTQENQDIQALFVQVGQRVEASTYPQRAGQYDHVVAELNATELQIMTRPLPHPDALKKANEVLRGLHVGQVAVDPNFSEYPSARSVSDLADTIKHMQAADQAKGLRGAELQAFENQARVYLIQAITYENFLKR
jgi:hypothetical protein